MLLIVWLGDRVSVYSVPERDLSLSQTMPVRGRGVGGERRVVGKKLQRTRGGVWGQEAAMDLTWAPTWAAAATCLPPHAPALYINLR